jgi:hypothetical protein
MLVRRRRLNPPLLVCLSLTSFIICQRLSYGGKPDLTPRQSFLFTNCKRLLAEDAIASATLYDATTGVPIRRFTASKWIAHMAVTPDDSHVLIVGGDGIISLWSAETGQIEWAIPTDAERPPYIFDSAFAQDGRSCVLCRDDETLIVLRILDGRPIRKVRLPEGHALSAALSPDGSTAVFVTLSPCG